MIGTKSAIQSGALGLSAAALIFAAPAQAGFPVEQEMTCAVGGEKFTFITTPSYSTFGARPDGKPYGSWTFPLALPECPDNKLVMYRDFEEAEIEQLASFLDSPEFTAVREESQYYRAAVIARLLNDDTPYLPLSLLLRASWEADFDAELKARYQREFAETAGQLPADHENLSWIALSARAANAWRELGEFERAEQTLASLPASIAPPADSRPADDDYSDGARDARARVYWEEYRRDLATEISDRNTESEPLRMMSERFQIAHCLKLQNDPEATVPKLCQTPEMQAEIGELKRLRAEWEQDYSAEAAEEAMEATAEAAEEAMDAVEAVESDTSR